MDYRKAFNLEGEVHERLRGQKGEQFLTELDRFLKSGPAQPVAAETYLVLVDYTMRFAKMIRAGNYDWVNDNITAKNFPIIGSGQEGIALRIVHFNRDISTKKALTELDKRNLRPATLAELLAFGAKYPEFQRKFPITALGSVSTRLKGFRFVACLREEIGKRVLSLCDHDSDFRGGARFLAVGMFGII